MWPNWWLCRRRLVIIIMLVVIVGKPKNLRNCWILEVNMKHGRLSWPESYQNVNYNTLPRDWLRLLWRSYLGMGVGQEGGGGRFDFWNTQPLQPSQLLDFPTSENGNNIFFYKKNMVLQHMVNWKIGSNMRFASILLSINVWWLGGGTGLILTEISIS